MILDLKESKVLKVNRVRPQKTDRMVDLGNKEILVTKEIQEKMAIRETQENRDPEVKIKMPHQLHDDDSKTTIFNLSMYLYQGYRHERSHHIF